MFFRAAPVISLGARRTQRAASERPRPRNTLLLRSRLLYQFNSCGGGAVSETGAWMGGRARTRLAAWGEQADETDSDESYEAAASSVPNSSLLLSLSLPRPPSHLALSCCGGPTCRLPSEGGEEKEGGRSLLPLAPAPAALSISVVLVERGSGQEGESEREAAPTFPLAFSVALASDVLCISSTWSAPIHCG